MWLLLWWGCAGGSPDRREDPPDTDVPPAESDVPDPCDLASDYVARGDAAGWLLDGEAVPSFDLLLSEEAIADLRQDYVTAAEDRPEVCGALVTEHGTLGHVRVKLRGHAGSSYQPIDQKPYFQLGFEDGTLDGLQMLRLYNQREDPSQIAQHVALGMWRRAGLAAPRSGFAWVQLNGEPLGLYATLEPIDEVFLDAHFHDGGAGQLFEGEYGADLRPGYTDGFEQVLGDGRDALDDLTTAIGDPGLGEDAGGLLEFEEPGGFLDYWALEVAVGAVEGYTYQRNNYFLYFTAGKWTFIPWGMDRSLVVPTDPCSAYGWLPRESLADPALAAMFTERLSAIGSEAAFAEARADAEAAWSLVAPYREVEADAQELRDWYDYGDSENEVTRLTEFLNERPARLAGVSCP
jgi:hypothetical protein